MNFNVCCYLLGTFLNVFLGSLSSGMLLIDVNSRKTSRENSVQTVSLGNLANDEKKDNENFSKVEDSSAQILEVDIQRNATSAVGSDITYTVSATDKGKNLTGACEDTIRTNSVNNTYQSNGLDAHKMSSRKVNEIKVLRRKGFNMVSANKIQNAFIFYSASLQLMDGVAGDEIGELRCRSALSLAECNLMLGEIESAISVLSEIIDESPILNRPIAEHDGSLHSMKDGEVEANVHIKKLASKLLGFAYHRRGHAFKRLGMPVMALLDFIEGTKFYPDEKRLTKSLESINNHVRVVNRTHLFVYSDDNKRNAEIHVGMESLREEHTNIIESMKENFPRQSFPSSAVKTLLQGQVSKHSPRLIKNDGAGRKGGLPEIGISGDILSSIMGDGRNGGNGLNVLSGLSSLTGLFTDSSTVQNLGEMYRAVTDVANLFKATWKLVQRHRNFIVLGLTVLWIAVSVFSVVLKYRPP